MRYSQENILSDSRYFAIEKTHEIQNSMRQYFALCQIGLMSSNIEIKQP